ncbi:MAG: hypothetical protein Q9M32_07880 [Sulfurimonas sp.]|nr:hypothetical protein [Sulfurimonas sp.]MDQ7061679.1 hypothetical protein [Sulfurimonas sp.]
MNKLLLQTFIVLALAYTHSFANEYKDIVNIELKKDEYKKILVKYGATQRLFKFRWTLFTNGGLVIFKSFDRIVSQNILYLRHKNQSFRVELMTRGANPYAVPYILVKFNEFDYETSKAKFQLFLSDPNSKVALEYLDDK